MTKLEAASFGAAKFGAAALAGEEGRLPIPFPRVMGKNTMKYLSEVVDAGLAINMSGRLEQKLAGMLGRKHCVASPGCNPAMKMAAAALRLEPGDEVIVSCITDYGTITGLIELGLIPVFADTEPDNVNISARTIEAKLTTRTRAIICVHMTGLFIDMDPVMELARDRGLFVIEDVCQSAFGIYKGRLAGTLADAACFSFDSEKTIGSDIAGALVTDDEGFADFARFIGHSRGGQMKPRFGRVHTHQGFAHRLPQVSAAVTIAQLEDAEANVTQRDRMIRLMIDELGKIPGILPPTIPDHTERYSCWMASFRIDPERFRCDADQFAEECAEAGIPKIGTCRYYLMPAALPFLSERAERGEWPYSSPPATGQHRYVREDCPNASAYIEHMIRWASFCEKYTEQDVATAVEIVATVAKRHRR